MAPTPWLNPRDGKKVHRHVFRLDNALCNPALQAVQEMLGVALHNQLHVTRPPALAGLSRGNEDIGQLGLNLRVQMNLGLFHPYGGMRWAVKRLHQRRQHLRNSEANIGNLDFWCLGVCFHQHFVFLTPCGHGAHRKVVNDTQVFEPRSNELGKTRCGARPVD